ncbi:MAG: metallophosphoesterase family protein [Candidatus Zixiibacteriota bacterium]
MSNNSIAIISDIHGNRWALEQVLKDIESRGIEKIVNLGDSFYGPLDPLGTAELLLSRNIISIRGNEDRIIVETDNEHGPSPTLKFVRSRLNDEHKNWLADLKSTLIFDDILLCHGTPANDIEYLLWEVTSEGMVCHTPPEKIESLIRNYDVSLVLCGHSHVPCDLKFPNGKLVVDSGSVGLQAYTDDVPYEYKMSAGTPHARYTAMTKIDGEWGMERIKLEYDWDAASRMALANNRKDWARWLKTGLA